MLDVKKSLPGGKEIFRCAVYAGDIFILPANETSLAIVEDFRLLLSQAFNLQDLTSLHQNLDSDSAHAILTRIRTQIKNPEFSKNIVAKLTDSFGIATDNTVFDIIRLRNVRPNDQKNIKAVAAYTMHRDTWYANSKCQINWWMPLYDVSPLNTFRFYPRYFANPIENTSDNFDYDSWSKNYGFQSALAPDAVDYPTISENTVDDHGNSFSCKAGDVVIFSASHLHQTCHNESGFSRFNIDFRTVHLGDKIAGLGAPDIDNRSRGDATKDYLALKC